MPAASARLRRSPRPRTSGARGCRVAFAWDFLSNSGPCVGSRSGVLKRMNGAVERFGMAEKEQAVRGEMACQTIHHRGLRFAIEVDEHIAAEDQIERTVD